MERFDIDKYIKLEPTIRTNRIYKKSIEIRVPYLSRKPTGWEQSWLQKAWIDQQGSLNIEIVSEKEWELRYLNVTGRVKFTRGE